MTIEPFWIWMLSLVIIGILTITTVLFNARIELCEYQIRKRMKLD